MIAPQHPRMPPWQRPHVDPAPTMLKNWRCSACNVPSQVIADGEMRICPQCYALLWHQDYSAEARRAREAKALEAELARREGQRLKHEEFLKRQAQRLKLKLEAKSLTTSAPKIGAPEMNVPIQPPERERTSDD
jgi:hypothetical protein